MMIEYTNSLAHAGGGNPNHDPKTGRFTFGRRRYVYTYKDKEGNKQEELTTLGQKRFDRAKQRNANKPKDKRAKSEDDLLDPDQWVRDDLSSATDLVNSAKTMIESASKISTELKSSKTNKRLDLSNMTTQQIREANEREAAERRYNELFNAPTQSTASKFIDGFFKYALPTVSLAGGILGAAVAIKNLKDGK